MPGKGKAGAGNPVKRAKEQAQKEALACPMKQTGHTSFDTRQSEILRTQFKTEARVLAIARKAMDSDDESDKRPVMSPQRQPHPEETALLFEGTSRQGLGRAQYLRLQARKSPKDRFHAPMTSAQVCGWDADSARFAASPHSKKQVIENTFYRKQGAFNPDLS